MGEDPANAAVSIESLRKRYGRLVALDGVDLAVAPGEAFGLVGANGAGKTTLIKCLLDLCAYDAGTVRIFGLAAELPQSRRRLAYVPERFMPPHYLRAREFLELMARSFALAYDAGRARSMSGLDPAARVAVKSVLRRLAAEGRTLVFTSHVLADVEELCSSIAVLENGSVRWHGPPEGLCARYGEARLEQAFMRCVRGQ
jgi:ABC-2 type transport system ATP-binding protein